MLHSFVASESRTWSNCALAKRVPYKLIFNRATLFAQALTVLYTETHLFTLIGIMSSWKTWIKRSWSKERHDKRLLCNWWIQFNRRPRHSQSKRTPNKAYWSRIGQRVVSLTHVNSPAVLYPFYFTKDRRRSDTSLSSLLTQYKTGELLSSLVKVCLLTLFSSSLHLISIYGLRMEVARADTWLHIKGHLGH